MFVFYYIRHAFRKFLRQKVYSFINIFGLAAGLAAAFFVWLYILNELAWDKYHENKNRIYRVLSNDQVHKWVLANAPFPLAEALNDECPEVEKLTHISRISRINIEKDNQWIEEKSFYSADTSVLEIFSFPLLNGNQKTVLSQPHSLVIAMSMARKYFGNEDPINKILKVRIKNEEFDLTITGVINDPPAHLTFSPGFIVSIDFGLEAMTRTLITVGGDPPTVMDLKSDWDMSFFDTYLLLKPTASAIKVQDAFRMIEEKYMVEKHKYTFDLQPLKEIYLGSADLINSETPSGNRQEIYIFSVIAFLIILVSILNYMLLYSNQAMLHLKEYGIKKVFGASRADLSGQIITETLLVAFIVLPVALYLVEQFRPWLSNFLDKMLIIEPPLNWQYPMGFLFVTIFVGLIPGVTIISFISKIQPVQAIESKRRVFFGQSLFRNILAFVQFVIFYLLLINILGIYKQIQFTRDEDLGFQWKNLLVVSLEQQNMADHFNILKDEFIKHPDIISISGAMWIPPSDSRMSINIEKPDGSGDHINLEALFVEKDFLETMGIKIIEGRSLADFEGEENMKIILSDKASELLGIDNYFGVKLGFGEIVGRMGNIHTHSFREEIPPLVIVSGSGQLRKMVIRYREGKGIEILNYINRKIKGMIPGSSPEIVFIEDIFNEVYRDERRTFSIVALFTLITMCLCTMGLFGMSMYNLERRTREFAIRKVNGAGIVDILLLITRKHLVFVFLALLVASPIAYLFLRRWLINFVYKTPITLSIFLLSGIVAMLIVLITISYYTIKAARSNPADNLRYE